MYKYNAKFYKVINLKFYVFSFKFLKNNLFISLNLNNIFLSYKSFRYLQNNNYNYDLLNFFNYFFVNSKYILKNSLFIFKIKGLSNFKKFFLRKSILNFLKVIKFVKGFIFFIETTGLSFNGSRKKKKKRKKKLKKKKKYCI